MCIYSIVMRFIFHLTTTVSIRKISREIMHPTAKTANAPVRLTKDIRDSCFFLFLIFLLSLLSFKQGIAFGSNKFCHSDISPISWSRKVLWEIEWNMISIKNYYGTPYPWLNFFRWGLFLAIPQPYPRFPFVVFAAIESLHCPVRR